MRNEWGEGDYQLGSAQNTHDIKLAQFEKGLLRKTDCKSVGKMMQSLESKVEFGAGDSGVVTTVTPERAGEVAQSKPL